MIFTMITPALMKLGYTKVRNSFYISHDGNWGIINFQLSQKSGFSQKLFTVNVGIASKRILAFLGFQTSNRKPGIWDTQFRMRLGHLLPENKDVWWSLDQDTNIESMGRFIQDLVVIYALPTVEKYIADESLRDLWMTGNSPSLTEIERLLYLSVLVQQIGPIEILEPTIKELERQTSRKPSAIMAEVFIKKLKGFQ